MKPFFVFLLLTAAVFAKDLPGPERFEKAIAAFEQADKVSKAPKNGTLFVGASNIRRWESLPDRFKKDKVINRGFGGAFLSEVVHFADRIVLPYEPKQIYLNAGGNDLHMGRTPEEVLASFKAFAALVAEKLPKTKLAFLCIPTSPSRWEEVETVRTTNKLIANFIHAGGDQIEFIDYFPMLLGADGKPLGDFNGLKRDLATRGEKLLFATNAGIFERGPKPCGVTIIDGRELVPLNLQPGDGNFYLKPNGVFFLDDRLGPGVMEAAEFARSGLKPRLATQSGPLMLRGGVIHPAFNVNSPNRRQRSAVGVREKDRQIIFAISDREDPKLGGVTFHQFSRFFLHLGCKDVLYLDGDISTLVVDPPADAKFKANTFAAMFYIATKEP